MPPFVAAVAFGFLILGLFWLDRDVKAKTSAALWLPVLWLSLAGSRQFSQWLQLAPPAAGGTDQYLEGSPIDRLVYAAMVFAGWCILVARRHQTWKLIQANWPIALFFAYCAMSLAWSDYPDVGLKRWVKASGDFVMVLIVLSDRQPFVAVKRLLTRTAFLLIPLSVLFIKYYPELGRVYGRWDWNTYYTGVTTNKNNLGVICLLLGLTSLWNLLVALRGKKDVTRNRRIAANGIILGMALWLFSLAGSTTALGCFVMAGTLLLMITSRNPARKASTARIMIGSMVAGSAVVLFLGISPILRALGKDPTLTDRTDIWSLLFTMVSRPLIGTGFESFWLGSRLEAVWKVYSWGPNQAHNGYIETFLNLGWAGIALLAVVLLRGYRTAFSSFREGVPGGELVLAFFMVGVIYNFTEAALFRMMAPAWIVFMLSMVHVPERAAYAARTQAAPAIALRWQPGMPRVRIPAGFTARKLVPAPRDRATSARITRRPDGIRTTA